MLSRITVLSNAPAHPPGTDAWDFAFRDLLTILKRVPDREVFAFDADTLCPPQQFRNNFLTACSKLTSQGAETAERIVEAAKLSDAFLLGDVRGLSLAEWIPALTLSRRPIPWVCSDWPREFPACDPVWETHRHGPLPRRLIASACLKLAYKSDPVHRDRLTPVTSAIFASRPLQERNRRSFPQLENAYIVPPPLDTAVFRFKPANTARNNAWGWIGDVEAAPEDAAVALRIFAFEALQNPECRFYIASPLHSAEAQKMLAGIRAHPALAPRVSFLKPPESKTALAAMLRDLGVLILPRRHAKNEFPLLAATAIACGCLPLCGQDAETEALIEAPEFLFPADAPSAAFLRCEKIKALPPDARSELLARIAQKITESASHEAVAQQLETILRNG